MAIVFTVISCPASPMFGERLFLRTQKPRQREDGSLQTNHKEGGALSDKETTGIVVAIRGLFWVVIG